MRKRQQYRGFSLTEVLLAVGALAVGMIFISGTFLTGIYFSTISTERTIAAVVVDEAFAKIRIYGINLADPGFMVNQQISFKSISPIPENQFSYPSTLTEKQYFWSALCRPVYSGSDNQLVQVTVFVSRKVGSATTYPGGVGRPVPIWLEVSQVSNNTLQIIGDKTLINDGSTIIDDENGQLYRVLERYSDNDSVILLDRPWQPGTVFPDKVWVIPRPEGGGKNPCIAVYQRLIRF